MRNVAGFEPKFLKGGSSRAVHANVMHLRLCRWQVKSNVSKSFIAVSKEMFQCGIFLMIA